MTTDRKLLDALLARVSTTSRAWRNRRYLYQAAERFDYCVHHGFPADAERLMWFSLLLWVTL